MREQRRTLSLFLALTLLFSLLYPMSLVGAIHEPGAGDEQASPNGTVEIEENTVAGDVYGVEPGQIINENIFTNVELTFYKNETSDEEVGRVDRETIIQVEYTWQLPNGHGYQAGAKYHFQLPEELVVYEAVEDGDILADNGQKIASLRVERDGRATIEFTDFIEQNSNIHGALVVLTKINETVFIEEGQKVTITPIEDGDSIEIPINFEDNSSTIEKRGILVKEDGKEKIDWTVDFNKTLATIENAAFLDPIQAGQKLKEGSVKVYELLVRLDGSVEQGDEITNFSIEKIDGDQDFKINLGTINSAYRVVFTTEITNLEQKTFKNEASLLGDNIDGIKAEATVTTDRGTPLAKRDAHYDETTQTITWEIKYNYNRKHIPYELAWLEDFFYSNKEPHDSQEFVEGSLKVKEITIGENGQEVEMDFENYTLTLETKEEVGKQINGFKLQFNQDIGSAYKITYQTKASKRVFENERITNKVESGTGDKGEGIRDIRQGILIKAHTGADYLGKIAKWKVTFNKDNYVMHDVVLKDVFPSGGLTLNRESLEIKDAAGRELQEGLDKDYTLVVDGDGPFTITFNHPIRTQLTITYETYFSYEDRDPSFVKPPNGTPKDYFENEAILTWKDEQDKEYTQKEKARFTPDNFTKSNGFKGGSYNAVTKEITWNIGVNYNLVKLGNAIVTDDILDGQKFVDGSLEIFKMDLTGGQNGYEKGDPLPPADYVEFDRDAKGNITGFTINLGEIDSAYLITYKTSLKDMLIQSKYNNTALLLDGEDLQANLKATVSIAHGDEYTKKSGLQNGKIIDWQVNINYGQSKVSNAKVFDRPSDNHRLLEDSFHLFATTVAENGNVTKGAELVRGEDYTLTFTDEGGFELAFLSDIHAPYILEYQSLILTGVGNTIKNVVEFSGEGVETEKTRHESSVVVKRTTGIGSGRGEVGSLVVTKLDAEDGTPLAGAEFTLIDEHTKAVIKTVTTGTDGIATFERLLYGDYLLKESKAPEGYVAGISGEERVKVVANPTLLTVENQKAVQAVKLTKVDKDDPTKKLAGAEFKLEREEDATFVKVGSYTTNEQGEIVINNLPVGNYRFIETKAPEHYLPDNSPIEFSIKVGQTTMVEVEKQNERGKGKLILTKVDAADEHIKLEGAIFKLYNSANELIDTKTSGADGQVVFENLPYDRYTLREITAPTNYIIDITEEQREILIDKHLTEQTITNKKLERSFKLIKVDAGNNNTTLAGAVFELRYKAPGSSDYIVIGTEKLTTDQHGEIIVNDLAVGDYQLIEITAPRGYILDSTPIEFTIDKEQVKRIELTKENRRRGGGGGGGNPPSGGGDSDSPGDNDNTPEDDKDPKEKDKEPNSEETPEQWRESVTESDQDSASTPDNDTDPTDENRSIETRRLSDSDNHTSQNKKLLPQTGEALPWTPFLGLLLLIAAFYLWFRKSRIQD